MDKMLNVFYQVRSSRDKMDAMESQSVEGLNEPSFMTLASSTVSQILLPVESIKKFDMRCWDAFYKYSRPVGDLPLDKCERGLPAYSLFPALDFISEKVRKMDVEEEIVRFALQPEDTIAWTEFKHFCDSLFEPVLEGKRNKPVTWDRPGLPSTPYTIMMRKQRTVGQLSYADLAGRTSTSTLIRNEKIRDVLMPNGDMGDAVVRAVRKVGDKHAQSLMRSLHTGPTDSGGRMRVLAPLQKSTVSDLAHKGLGSDAYTKKWIDMREKRAMRKSSINARASRKSMMTLLSRQVISQDRASMHTVLKYKEDNVGKETEVKYKQAKEQQKIIQRNIDNWKDTNKQRKEKNASSLKLALNSSVSDAKSLLEQELNLKRKMKPPHLKLPAYSSTMVDVPVELKDKMANARKEKEFREAEKAVHQYVKEELDHRVSTLSRARSEAVLQTAFSGAHVKVAPIRGNDVFDDPMACRARTATADDNILYVDYNTYLKTAHGNPGLKLDGTTASGANSLVDDSTFATQTGGLGYGSMDMGSVDDCMTRSYSAAGLSPDGGSPVNLPHPPGSPMSLPL
jgi:hypothetical protein